MKRKMIVLCGCLLLGMGWLWAQGPGGDPINANFFTPDLLRQAEDAIGLTEDQKNFLMQEMRDLQEHMKELQERLKAENEALASVTKPERLDENAVMTQLDKIMDVEHEIKRNQLGLLVRIKNKLTAPQQAKLREVKEKMTALQPKMRRLYELARSRQEQGQNVSALEQLRSEMQPLIAAGKFKEAEAAIERAIKSFEAKEKK